MLAALLEADHDPVHMVRKKLCRKSGDGVALVDNGWYMEFVRGGKYRVADVAAGTDNDIGLEGADDLLCLVGRDRDVLERVDIVENGVKGMPAADIGHLQPDDIIALSGDKLHLHLALCTDEEEAAVGQKLLSLPATAKAGLICPAVPPQVRINFIVGPSIFQRSLWRR